MGNFIIKIKTHEFNAILIDDKIGYKTYEIEMLDYKNNRFFFEFYHYDHGGASYKLGIDGSMGALLDRENFSISAR